MLLVPVFLGGYGDLNSGPRACKALYLWKYFNHQHIFNIDIPCLMFAYFVCLCLVGFKSFMLRKLISLLIISYSGLEEKGGVWRLCLPQYSLEASVFDRGSHTLPVVAVRNLLLCCLCCLLHMEVVFVSC